MHLLLTRPEQDSRALAQRLEGLGHRASIAPMLAIELLPEAPLELDGVQAVLLTSANGAPALARAAAGQGFEAVFQLPAFTVGEASRAAALEAGFARVRSAGGDVESLAALVTAQAKPEDGPLLQVAATELAGDLAGSLGAAGFEVRRAVLYDAVAATMLPAEIARALGAGGIDGVLLFSPRTAATFVKLIAESELGEACPGIEAFCLSQAVAGQIEDIDWAAVRIAERPELDSLLELLPKAERGEMAERDHSKAEATGPVAEAAAPAGKRRWLLAVAIAFLVGMALWPVLGPWVAPHLPGGRGGASAAFETELKTLKARLSDAEAELKALRGQAKAKTASGRGLEQRLQKLEAGLAKTAKRLEVSARSTVAATDLAAIGERIETLDKRLAKAGAGQRLDARSLANLQTAAENLAAGLESLEARFGTLEAASGGAGGRRQAVLLAVGQLRQVLAEGRPYQVELDRVRPLAGTDGELNSALERLSARAPKGLKTVAELSRLFQPLAGAIVRAGAGPEPTGWLDISLRRVSDLVSVRRTGEVPGAAVDAIVARAELRLGEGRLAQAIAELETLSGAAQGAVTAWLQLAKARLEADRAAARLEARAIRLLAES